MTGAVVFGGSAAVLWLMTNLDNLAALVALILVIGPSRAILAFAGAQSLALGAAVAAAFGFGIVPDWTGYLGIVPVALGAMTLLRQKGASDDPARPDPGHKTSTLAATLLFLSMSTDSFAVLAPFLADALPQYRGAGAFGALLASGGLIALGVAGSHGARTFGGWTRRLERTAPVVMILAGLYVLANTATDMV